MISCANSVLLCWKTERIVSHWVKYVVALHTFHTGNDICCCISFWMTNMKTISKEYLLLFNAVTDTEESLRQLREKLVAVQQQAEELFLEETDPAKSRKTI